MKFPKTRKGMFLLITLAYALTLDALSFVTDYRYAVGGFMLLQSVAFGLAVWAWLKTTKLVTALLIAGLLAAPVEAGEQYPPPDKDSTVVMGCCVIAIGAIVIYSVWKLCKKMPKIPKPTDPPPTNILIEPFFTRADLSAANNPTLPPLLMPDGGVSQWLTNGVWEIQAVNFQSSTNSIDWKDEYTVTNWITADSVISILYSNQIPREIKTAPVYWTNDVVPLTFTSAAPMSKLDMIKLWRAVNY